MTNNKYLQHEAVASMKELETIYIHTGTLILMLQRKE